jgi:hypothetical protein
MNRRLKLSDTKIGRANTGDRAVSSNGGGQSLYKTSGVKDTGVDAREFLKFYI